MNAEFTALLVETFRRMGRINLLTMYDVEWAVLGVQACDEAWSRIHGAVYNTDPLMKAYAAAVNEALFPFETFEAKVMNAIRKVGG